MTYHHINVQFNLLLGFTHCFGHRSFHGIAAEQLGLENSFSFADVPKSHSDCLCFVSVSIWGELMHTDTT